MSALLIAPAPVSQSAADVARATRRELHVARLIARLEARQPGQSAIELRAKLDSYLNRAWVSSVRWA